MIAARPPTLRQLATSLGLSPGLVSRVLNRDSTCRCTAQTRRRIVEAAAETGYRPSPSARALATGHSRQIAILGGYTGLNGSRLSKPSEMSGMAEAAFRRGYGLLLLPSIPGPTIPTELDAFFRSAGCDGLCCYADQVTHPFAEALRLCGLPYSVLGRSEAASGIQIDIDGYAYAHRSVGWLREQGHTRIALADFLPAHLGIYAAETIQGYEDAVDKFCDGATPELIVGASMLDRISHARANKAPSAIIVPGLASATRWRVALQRCGKRIPEDVALLVHTPSAETAYLEPGLAFHPFDAEAIAATAVDSLVDAIENPNADRTALRLIPPLPPRWRSEWL